MKYQFSVDKIDLETGHGQVLSQIIPGSCVLECGCATGYITKFMKEQLGCKVYIVEYEQEAFNIARQYAEGGVCADLMDDSWTEAFDGMQFDYILFMDVLEHLTNPNKTLLQATSLLKQEGTVLISLPNIAHNDILINMHRDSFNYTNLGLLDNTHIHFFGKNNLSDFIRGAGLEMVRLGKTNMKTGCSEQFWETECRIPDGLLPVLANHECGEVYQFIIAAQKKEYCEEKGLELVDDISNVGYSDTTVGILDVYRQYTHVLEQLNERNAELLLKQEDLTKLLLEKKEIEKQHEEVQNNLRAAEFEKKEIEKQFRDCQNKLNEAEMMSLSVKSSYDRLKEVYNQIACSRAWRVLSKYYDLRDRLLPKDSIIRRMLKAVGRMLFGVRKEIDVISEIPAEQLTVIPVEDAFELVRTCKRIDILSVPHTEYLAKMLQNVLLEAGLECQTHLAEPEQYENIPYIMICPQNFKRFPAVYIAMQMEQTINPRWLTEEYMNILHNAYAVFDYSLENIKYFNQDPLLASKMYYMPVDICKSMMEADYSSAKKEYDVLFYGAPFVEHRQNFLKPIGERFNLRVVSEQFGPDLYREMNKAKIIINIHYYENALLETTRLYETLSVSDCLIISEKSGDPREEARLEGLVDFVEVGDVEAMMERIQYWLTHEEERKAKVASNRAKLKSSVSAVTFYLNRFLLANDRITFDEFYNAATNYIHFDTDRVCLSLPESTIRAEDFKKDNKYGFEFFPGLKHRIGWIGCGMSYKFMLRKAMEQQMERILICEDDVYFPPDFEERFGKVLDYVEKNDDWTVFSGIMADLGRVKPLKYVEENEEEFIYLDKMISMVFNLYDKSVFEAISNWDNTNRNVEKNTIDRYLENRKMRILTTCPFLVGHKEDLTSTIWGQQNTIYTELIQNSSVKLRELVDKFKKTQK